MFFMYQMGAGLAGWQKKTGIQLWEIALAGGLLLAVAITVWFGGFEQDCASLRQDTLRLHVKANSDSVQDQELKLMVRDAILEYTGWWFSEAGDKQQAMAFAQSHLQELQAVAQRTVNQQGSNQTVQVSLVEMDFPTTHYENFTLPAGRYDAVRVDLGQAEGHNWFCVLYPSLCLPTSSPADYPEKQQQNLLKESNGYEIRFAALELAQQWIRFTHNHPSPYTG